METILVIKCVYENNTLVNMTCSDTLCKGNNHAPLCIKPGYHLGSTCDLVQILVNVFLFSAIFNGSIVRICVCIHLLCAFTEIFYEAD